MSRMVKQLTFIGKLEDGNPHKTFWFDKSYEQRLAAANELIIRTRRISSLDNCRMFKIFIW
jgi:hypothetical protein